MLNFPMLNYMYLKDRMAGAENMKILTQKVI